MTRWMKAHEIPKSWEGKQAWRWNTYDKKAPHLDYIPFGMSRDPQHSEGIWFRLPEIPRPPRRT